MSETSVKAARGRMICAVLLIGTLLLFARAWRHDFVNYDDPDYVTKNVHVQAGLTAESVRWAFATSDVSYWHPLTWLSHMADWQLYGDHPHGHHATSILIHAINAVLVFLVFRRLTGATWASALCAAVFAWHPLRAESVAWVAERKDVLSGFFALATLWAYAVFAQRRRDAAAGAWWFYGAALALFAGGLMSKPMLVTLPAVLLILDWWPLARVTKKRWVALLAEKVPFGVLSLAVSAITIHAQRAVGTLSEVLPPGARLANAVVAVARYVGKFFWPFDLAVLYPHPGFWPAGRVALAVLFFVAVTGIALWQMRRRPWVLAGWLFFLVSLLPASGVVQVGIQSMADRYTYLTMIGIAVAVIWTVREWVTSRGAAVTLATVVLVMLAARTWNQLAVWRDSLALFDHTLKVAPAGNYLAYNNRGLALFAAGRVDEALSDYRESLAINPTWMEANNNLGYTLAQTGHPAEAIPYYRKALAAKPDQPEVQNNLANALSDVGQLDEAVRLYEAVLARQPDHVNALNGLGVTLAMQGHLPEAVAKFEAALRVDPNSGSAHSNLGNAFAILGRRDEAIASYQRALAVRPDDAPTLNTLANVLEAAGRWPEAVATYRRAIAFAAVNPTAHANLGHALAQLGQRDEAIAELRIALQQKPDDAQARAWLAELERAKN
ncbi:tetratricopeptide repeat protein [Horticoccus luteus]|uniref:Tetratricopeptide repeat protein n=1 Tax=Horticoccus luteus TaxID=2862869 RepID=A0A8F9TW42_9BACT|nr:tetratricopeptide repeat protein [Horticoccus luteus]QYM80324.1 tetratricopeptide repeat protein [Horticoccus luteus]